MSRAVNVRYEYRLSACRFNSEDAYEAFKAAQALQREGSFEDALYLWQRLASDCHGHDFSITVELRGADEVEVEIMAAYILRWDRTNLSLNAELVANKERPSVERMASVLCAGIKQRYAPNCAVTVTVAEPARIAQATY